MDAEAYNLLDRVGLPRPKVISVSEIKTLHQSCYVYLRGDKKYSELNRRVSAGELILSKRLEHLKKLESLGFLRTVEISPTSAFGAVVIVENEFLYGELSQGHISGLLHRGFCCLRFLFNFKKNTFTFIRESQPRYYSDETNEVLTIGPYINKNKLLMVAKKVAILASNLPPRHITEIIIDPKSNVLFVDCKGHDSGSDYLALFSGNRTRIIKQPTSRTTDLPKKDVATFIAEYRNPESLASKVKLVVKNEALLSHAFTYSNQVEQLIIYDSDQKLMAEPLI